MNSRAMELILVHGQQLDAYDKNSHPYVLMHTTFTPP